MTNVRIKQRFDTEANWLSSDVVLLDGELAVVDCGSQVRFKIGDGGSIFTQLKYLDQDQLSTLLLAVHAISQGSQSYSVPFGLAAGYHLSANADFSQALGVRSQTSAGHSFSFVWNGDDSTYQPIQIGTDEYYMSHGKGTFNINPLSGIDGFYIGEQTLGDLLSNATGSKIAIDDRISGISAERSDLSIIKLDASEYAQLVSTSAIISNCLYVVENAYTDAYGQQIKNLSSGTDLSDAVTLEQLSNAISNIQIPSDLSSFTNSPGYLVSNDISGYYKKSETSSASEIQSALDEKQPSGNYALTSQIPVNVSQLSNDAEYLTKHQSLSNYYTKNDTSSAAEISNALSGYIQASAFAQLFQNISNPKNSVNSVAETLISVLNVLKGLL